MNYEEILVKLGLDGGSLSQGVRQLKTQMSDLSEHGHAGFVHMGNSGRAFHKLMEQIKDISPGAATGLQMIFSPITGAIVAATAVLAFFNEKLKELNAEMDKVSLENLKPIGDAWNRNREVSDKINESIDEQAKYLKEQKFLHNEVVEKMKEELAAAKATQEIDKQRLTTKEKHAELDAKSAQKELAIVQAAHDKLKSQKELAEFTARRAASNLIEAGSVYNPVSKSRTGSYIEQLSKAEELQKENKTRMEAATTRRNALKIASSQVTEKDKEEFRLLPSWQEIKDLAGSFAGQKGLSDKLKEAEEEVNHFTEAYHKNTHQVDDTKEALKNFKENLDSARKAAARLDSAYQQTVGDLTAAKQRATVAESVNKQAHSLSPFVPSLDQFAQARGPLGDLARRIGATQAGIANRLLVGDTVNAEKLRKQLQGYDVQGLPMPDWSGGRGSPGYGKLVTTKTHVKGLEEIWADILNQLGSNGGVPVKINSLPD